MYFTVRRVHEASRVRRDVLVKRCGSPFEVGAETLFGEAKTLAGEVGATTKHLDIHFAKIEGAALGEIRALAEREMTEDEAKKIHELSLEFEALFPAEKRAATSADGMVHRLLSSLTIPRNSPAMA